MDKGVMFTSWAHLTEPPRDPLTIITAHRIVYTDHWLRRSGYAPRQVWRPGAGRVG